MIHKNGAADTGGPERTDSTRPGMARLPVVRGEDRRRRVNSDDGAALLGRETMSAAREEAARLREDAAHHREGAVTTREQEILITEAIQAASDVHMNMLQQSNARLVTATIEAQKLTEQVLATKSQLQSAKLAAEKANLAKSVFLSKMSHELRSPLNAILGFAQLLEAGTPPPTVAQNERLQQIIKAGWYLLDLINEILDLAVIESGKLIMSENAVQLHDVMLECGTMVGPVADKYGIRLDFLPFDSDWRVTADHTRLKQVLVNLLSNAIKYNRKQGTVTIKCTGSMPGRIRVSITDTGAGLSMDQQAQLFQPFNRLGMESSSVEGSGIGLVVTKQLIEAMGGTIGLNSTAGTGSEFWIELNRADTSQFAGAGAGAGAAPKHMDVTKPHTLLYVEDNPANLLLVEHIIVEYPNLSMRSAHDASTGITLARNLLPDVILLDISLPDMSGFEVLNILRNDPATAHIPVIAISANAMVHDVAKGLEAGFFSYITKPIKINEFMNALHDVLLSIVQNSSTQTQGNTNQTGGQDDKRTRIQ